MAGNEATTKFFEAVNEGSDAVIDAVRTANDRGHRVATALIEEAQEGQREFVELAKKWIASPLDILGFYSHLVESTTKAQGRAMDVGRHWFGEIAEAQKESRQIVQRVVSANRKAGEASVDLARSVLTRSANGTNGAQSTSEADGRRATPSRATASDI